jgi:hypothetical protein
VGVRNRWLLGDLDHLFLRLGQAGDPCRPEGRPSRGRALLDFLTSTRPGMPDQVVRGDDPRPFLYELRQYARSSWAAAARRAGGPAARVRFRGPGLARPSIPN